MTFDSIGQLKEYTGNRLSDSEIKSLWQWMQKGMVAPEQVVRITRECRNDDECMVGSLKNNAWKTFIMNYKA